MLRESKMVSEDGLATKADLAALKSDLKLHICGMAAAVVAILKALEYAGL